MSPQIVATPKNGVASGSEVRAHEDPKMHEVDESLGYLRATIQKAHEMFNLLADDLQPILSQDEQPVALSTTKPEEGSRCPLALEVDTLRESVAALEDSISRIRYKVRL